MLDEFVKHFKSVVTYPFRKQNEIDPFCKISYRQIRFEIENTLPHNLHLDKWSLMSIALHACNSLIQFIKKLTEKPVSNRSVRENHLDVPLERSNTCRGYRSFLIPQVLKKAAGYKLYLGFYLTNIN
jgi:hypothetical protein